MSEQAGHSVAINGRKQLTMEGVQHVDSFNESEIILETNMGMVILKGDGMHITQLNLETGSIEAEGFFASLQYVEGKGKGKGKRFLGRILK
ncbi:MAG: Spore protein YabP [Pelotomaculum sp. PtaB.Bin013]|uniref:Sporulation protein YabP n=1 Tax=Pelotomaculum isophthalicicum JI TaxID=947010 RepID=A0A9X4JVZ2_9FIRM|nr:sporulation protein YabP [Pelotomaculum isophthalicicum]MDF9409221.1 sporulation protein YabP [Pelotomaculum isophthalicicum JI]OPX81833.1 MAG: Spore protein YabP [Pelotomaculum sp. PtaB.Bin013]